MDSESTLVSESAGGDGGPSLSILHGGTNYNLTQSGGNCINCLQMVKRHRLNLL